MKIKTVLGYGKITITEPQIADTYFIEQGENERFYITSSNGYFGYDGDGFDQLDAAIKSVKKMIKTYFEDRSEENPKGW